MSTAIANNQVGIVEAMRPKYKDVLLIAKHKIHPIEIPLRISSLGKTTTEAMLLLSRDHTCKPTRILHTSTCSPGDHSPPTAPSSKPSPTSPRTTQSSMYEPFAYDSLSMYELLAHNPNTSSSPRPAPESLPLTSASAAALARLENVTRAGDKLRRVIAEARGRCENPTPHQARSEPAREWMTGRHKKGRYWLQGMTKLEVVEEEEEEQRDVWMEVAGEK